MRNWGEAMQSSDTLLAQRSFGRHFGYWAGVLRVFWGELSLEGEGEVLMPPTCLYKLINIFQIMQEEEVVSYLPRRNPTQRRALQVAHPQSPSILLHKIQDQQMYLCLTSTLLQLARDAGAPSEALEQVRRSLLDARGLQQPHMLHHINQNKQALKRGRESYDQLTSGISDKEKLDLLANVEREISQARELERHYRCLDKYRAQKEDEIVPNGTTSPTSRKERFKRIVRNRAGARAVESSNFYKFQVNQILENTYKSQNECYRTINSFTHLKTMYGHCSDPDLESYTQVFNAILDRSENVIITAGEEGIIKVWHKASGSLIASLKGHTEFLNKIDTSKCNKYLLSSGGDGLRFFDLATLRSLGGWSAGSIQQISSFIVQGQNIFLFGDNSCLYALTEQKMLESSHRRLQLSDFYQFGFGDIIKKDNTSILVISLSPESTHLLLGLEDGHILMVLVSDLLQAMRENREGDLLILPCLCMKRAHSDQAIEIKWSKSSNMWTTGGKDGRCCLWELRNDVMELVTTLSVPSKKGRKKHNYSCTYICWNCEFSHFAAGFQENVEDDVGDRDRGIGQVLVYSLLEKGVTCQFSQKVSMVFGGIRAMDAHPFYPNILLICQAQGHIILFDLFIGCVINVFQERGYHIQYPQFSLIPTECHFSVDGLSFIVASQYGNVSIYGYDSKAFYSLAPTEQFLKVDLAQFTLEENTMRAIAIPHALDFEDDLNEYPRGQTLNIRGQPHQHAITIDPRSLLYQLNHPQKAQLHRPQVNTDPLFMKKIQENMKEGKLMEQLYSKTEQEIEKAKQVTLFYQRERQYSKITDLFTKKLKALKTADHPEKEVIQQERNEVRGRTRKLRRLAERDRVNYYDDFSYHDSEEEDYNAGEEIQEQDIPEQIEEQSFEGEEEPRLRRSHNQTQRPRRQTRQQNREIHHYELDEEEDQPQHERIPRRRRRQITDDILEVESENQPRKRQKLDSEQSEPKIYSRLRKQHHNEGGQIQPMEEQAIQCFRCQLAKATQFCYNCDYSQSFCDDCGLMRGRKFRNHFQCIICLFLKNTAQQQYEHVTEDCFRATKRSEENYLPQLQDKVRYFFQGYEQFLVQQIGRLNNAICRSNELFRLLPHTENINLFNTPLCKVISIEYLFPLKCEDNNSKRTPGRGERTPILMVLGLEHETEEMEREQFWVFYQPGQEFILKEEIYSEVMNKNILSSFSVNELIAIGQEEMQIVELGPFQDRFPECIWKSVKIRKTEGKRLRGNTKQIQRRVNVWKLTDKLGLPPPTTLIESRHVERLSEQIKQWLANEESQYCIFIDYVDFDIYPEYRKQVLVGMCLQTILARLQNQYYTCYGSLKQDIQLIYNNSVAFNGLAHQVTQNAKELMDQLFAIIGDEELPVTQIKPQEKQEDTTSKKEKRVKEVEQSEEGGELVTRKRTRREEQLNNRKRRNDSSDYEQQQSASLEDVGVSKRGLRNLRNRANYYQQEEAKRVTRSRTRH